MSNAAPIVPLIAKANAGAPRLEGDRAVYDATPEDMARYAWRVHDLGARIIGPEPAREIVAAFLGARFVGNDPGQERHLRRVAKFASWRMLRVENSLSTSPIEYLHE